MPNLQAPDPEMPNLQAPDPGEPSLEGPSLEGPGLEGPSPEAPTPQVPGVAEPTAGDGPAVPTQTARAAQVGRTTAPAATSPAVGDGAPAAGPAATPDPSPAAPTGATSPVAADGHRCAHSGVRRTGRPRRHRRPARAGSDRGACSHADGAAGHRGRPGRLPALRAVRWVCGHRGRRLHVPRVDRDGSPDHGRTPHARRPGTCSRRGSGRTGATARPAHAPTGRSPGHGRGHPPHHHARATRVDRLRTCGCRGDGQRYEDRAARRHRGCERGSPRCTPRPEAGSARPRDAGRAGSRHTGRARWARSSRCSRVVQQQPYSTRGRRDRPQGSGDHHGHSFIRRSRSGRRHDLRPPTRTLKS